MKTETFIQKIEEYYGAYNNDFQKQSIARYLDTYEPDKLPLLLSLVMKNHFARLGTPCMASIDKIHEYHHRGDYRNQIEGNPSLKKQNRVSACAPDPDEMHDWEDVGEDVLAIVKRAVKKS